MGLGGKVSSILNPKAETERLSVGGVTESKG